MTDFLETTRSCGGCVLCCKVLTFEAPQTSAGLWCQHCNYGGPKEAQKGCRIYRDDTLSSGCKEFTCLWLSGVGNQDERPDKIHAVMHVGPNKTIGEDVLYVTQSNPTAYTRRSVMREISEYLTRQKMFVIIEDTQTKKVQVLVPEGKALPPEAEIGDKMEVMSYAELSQNPHRFTRAA